MAANPTTLLSPQEYLEIDSKKDRPSEYLNGHLVEREATTENHALISTNLATAMATSLRHKKSPCRVYSKDLRVHMPATGLYAYPDLVVACADRKFAAYDTLLNPVLIAEVLSPSTQDYDHGTKFTSYRSIPSLQEYWTIAQDRMHLERWAIIQDRWTLTEYSHPSDILTGAGFEFSIADIYYDINFQS